MSKIKATLIVTHIEEITITMPISIADNLYLQLEKYKFIPNYNTEIRNAIETALGYKPTELD